MPLEKVGSFVYLSCKSKIMSWDIVLFSSNERIISVEDLNEGQLVPVDFCSILENHFPDTKKNEDSREIVGKDYSIHYYTDDAPVSNKMLSLYGENGLFALIELSKTQNWQIYDTGNGEMVDLENPARNGYENFQTYLRQILSK